MSEGVTITFELPIGYEDGDGKLHKTVVMRRLKNSDIIAIQADLDLKALAQKDVDLFSGNPAKQFLAAAAMAQLFAILYPRVIERIGTIEKPDRKVFEGLYQADANFLRKKYAEFNEIKIEEADSTPFVGGPKS